MKSYLISVVIPVYNTSSYIPKCLNSVISQTFKDIEIMVVNDGSTDNSVEIINKYMELDSRIKLVQKKNGGLSSARNLGIEHASGEYILHLDSDDWIESDYCEHLYRFAEKYNIDIVSSNLVMDWNDNTTIRKGLNNSGNKNLFSPSEWLELWLRGDAIANCCSKLIRASLYKDNHISHPESISLGEDLVTTPRLVFYAKNGIGHIDKGYYHYVQNPASIMNLKVVHKIYEISEVFKILDNFFVFNDFKINLQYLKIRHFSSLISNEYNMKDPYFQNAIKEFISFHKGLKLPSDAKRVTKIRIISFLFFISESMPMLRVIRFFNRLCIQVTRLVKMHLVK